MKYYEEDDYEQQPATAWRAHEQEIGCGYCWDARKKNNIELYFLDRANNMRVCDYCPSCGRKFG